MTRRVRPSVCLLAAVIALTAGCATSTSAARETPTSVPTSASVTAPAGPAVRSAPGATLAFGQSAVLPATAFAAQGPTAMYTVTGITPAEGVPDDTTRGGDPYFVYVTVTSLAARPAPAPGVIGLAGSPDGHTAALTLSPTPGLAKCPTTAPPARMSRGESYSTCLVSVADEGSRLRQVIYWADTAGLPQFDFEAAPVVWSQPGQPPTSVTPSAG
ncbi:hypothetical protein AAFP35_12555 [Gordonia sp. CPCC 206044]|uniref:hypothetical protein n=1 Tax=Gordonia sp. CPCC 206044 TaxID=3140793 RepID=UPI003AF33E8B